MAQPQQEHYYQYQEQHQTLSETEPPIQSSQTGKGIRTSSSTSNFQVLVLATLVPVGATLLILAGLTLAATVIGLALTTPLFVIFSPVFLLATLVIGFAVAGFLTSGAFGVTSISSFAWLVSYLRRSRLPERLKQYAKPNPQEEDTVAQGVEEAGESVEIKTQKTVQEAQSDAPEAEKAQTAQEAQNDASKGGKAQKGNRKTSS